MRQSIADLSMLGVALIALAAASGEGALSPDALGRWLCQAVLSDRPERVLASFPGGQASPVQSRVEKLWRDRPGRMKSPVQYRWHVTVADLRVEYGHLERPGRKYNFHIRIEGEGLTGAAIFTSSAEIERWLGRVGKVSKVSDEEGLIVPHFEAVAAGGRWRVTVGTERQNVLVSWAEERSRTPVRGFCP